MATYQIADKAPQIHDSAFVAEQAVVIGDVVLQENVSIWPGVVLRGDNESITIGAGSNVQEGAVFHTDPGYPLIVENSVSIGHQAMLHGCMVQEGSLIGIQAVILNGAVIGKNCLVGAGALITEGEVFPDNSLIIGSPAKVVRELTPEVIADMHRNAAEYVARRGDYKKSLKRLD